MDGGDDGGDGYGESSASMYEDISTNELEAEEADIENDETSYAANADDDDDGRMKTEDDVEKEEVNEVVEDAGVKDMLDGGDSDTDKDGDNGVDNDGDGDEDDDDLYGDLGEGTTGEDEEEEEEEENGVEQGSGVEKQDDSVSSTVLIDGVADVAAVSAGAGSVGSAYNSDSNQQELRDADAAAGTTDKSTTTTSATTSSSTAAIIASDVTSKVNPLIDIIVPIAAGPFAVLAKGTAAEPLAERLARVKAVLGKAPKAEEIPYFLQVQLQISVE
jgi:hypothetical protein